MRLSILSGGLVGRILRLLARPRTTLTRRLLSHLNDVMIARPIIENPPMPGESQVYMIR